MKIACYILSFYLIALAGVACADNVPLDYRKDIVSAVNSHDGNQNHDHQSDWDGCSPLCICQCCQAHFLSTPGFNFIHPEKPPVVYISYFQQFISIEISDFLKPPKS